MSERVRFPEMRLEVITALQSVSSTSQQQHWGKFESGINFFEDLTLVVHVLYDDCMVLPSPESAVPAVLYHAEVPAFLELERHLGPLLEDLGDAPDQTFINDSRWSGVMKAAQLALSTMEDSDRQM